MKHLFINSSVLAIILIVSCVNTVYGKKNTLVSHKNFISSVDNRNLNKNDSVYTRVEKMPEFTGGDKALLAFLQNNILFPMEATQDLTEGIVYLKFVVTKSGNVGDIAIIRSPHKLLSEEAVRVVKLLPKFIPGKEKGIPVNVWYTVPLRFKVDKVNGKIVYDKVEQMPEFPQGEKKLLELLSNRIKYPLMALEKVLEDTVYLKFVVTETGDIGDIVVENNPKKVFSREVMRVIKRFPKFKPGVHEGKLVSTWYRIPISFMKMSSYNSTQKHNGVYIICT